LTRRRVLCSRTGKCSSENVRYCSFARRMLYNIVHRFTNALSQRWLPATVYTEHDVLSGRQLSRYCLSISHEEFLHMRGNVESARAVQVTHVCRV